MLPSLFTPGGLLLLSDETPIAERLHTTIVRLLTDGQPGNLSAEVGSFVDCFAFAFARVLARVQQRQQQLDRERLGVGAYELLAGLEEEFGLKPGPTDTIAQRQLALSQAMKKLLGSVRPALEQSLYELHGADYIGVHIRNPENGEADVWPAALGDSPQLLGADDMDRKLVRLPDGISTDLGSSQSVAYVPIDPNPSDGGHSLVKGDMVVLGVENLGLAETVTVESTSTVGGTLYFTTTPNNAHDADALAVAMPFCAWGSSQRHIFVVLSATAAFDAEKLRKTHLLMARTVTGVTTWSVCPASGSDQAGPWTLDDSVLGRLDFNPMATINVP